MTFAEKFGEQCGDPHMFTPLPMTYQEAARELLERLASEKLAREVGNVIIKEETR